MAILANYPILLRSSLYEVGETKKRKMVKGHSLFLAEATSTDKHTHVGMCLHSQKNTWKRVTIRIRVTRNVFFCPRATTQASHAIPSVELLMWFLPAHSKWAESATIQTQPHQMGLLI